MQSVTIDEVRSNLQSVMFFVAEGKSRVRLVDGDEVRAAFISLEDLAILEALSHPEDTPIPRVSAEEFRSNTADLITRGERTIIRNEEDEVDLIALVPKWDVEALENLDGRIDLEAAKHLLDKQMKK